MVKEITEKRLRNITLYYLTRHDASVGKVKTMLKHRIAKTALAGLAVSPEVPRWIENILADMERLGYLNDTRYAENQIRLLTEQGKSIRFITQKLNKDGLDDDIIRTLLTDSAITDIDQARRFVMRKKIGPYRPPELQQTYLRKDMGTLGRAGFSYETARAVLTVPEEDC